MAGETASGYWGWLFGNDRPQQEVAVYQKSPSEQGDGTVLAVQVEDVRATDAGGVAPDRHDPIST